MGHGSPNWHQDNLMIPTGYCRNCLSELFPFNHIEDDELFVTEINKFRSNVVSLNTSSLELLFNPFELNEDDNYSPLCEIDPDVNFYNKIDSHLGSSCNYYFEDYFLEALSKKYEPDPSNFAFSLCHMNIRSIKANISSFETCLDNLDFNFSFIGVSETWLTEHNCNLYGLQGYHFAEMHRSNRSGGGVGIFIRENINFQLRPDLSKMDESSVKLLLLRWIRNTSRRKKISSSVYYIARPALICFLLMSTWTSYWIQ